MYLSQALSRRHRRGTAAAALIGVVSMILAACGSAGGSADGDASSPTSAKLAVSSEAASLLPAEAKDGLNIAIIAGALPLSDYTAGKKGYQGLNYDLVEALGQVLGVKMNYHVTTFANLIPGVSSKRYDIALAGIYDTAEREQTVDLVTYLTDGEILVVKKGKPTNLTEDDLCGKSVGVISGSAQAVNLPVRSKTCLADGKQPIDVRVFTDQPTAVLGTIGGRVDVFDISTSIGRYMIKQEAGPLVVGSDAINVVPVGMVLAQSSPLSKAVQAGVNVLIKDGAYARILSKWGLADSAVKSSEINPLTSK